MKKCPICKFPLRIIRKHPSAAWLRGKMRNYTRVLYACDQCNSRISNH